MDDLLREFHGPVEAVFSNADVCHLYIFSEQQFVCGHNEDPTSQDLESKSTTTQKWLIPTR